MFVRTLCATGDPAELDGAIEALSTEGRRLLSEQPGFRGFGLVVDRELGKLATATWWEARSPVRPATRTFAVGVNRW